MGIMAGRCSSLLGLCYSVLMSVEIVQFDGAVECRNQNRVLLFRILLPLVHFFYPFELARIIIDKVQVVASPGKCH